jgi:hypothetical protein
MTLPAQNVAPQIVAAPGQTAFPFSWRCDSSTLVSVWVDDVQVGGPASRSTQTRPQHPGVS